MSGQRKHAVGFSCCLLFVFCEIGSALAQATPGNIAAGIANTAQRQLEQQRQAQEALRDAQRNTESSSSASVGEEISFLPAPGGPCFEIETIDILGSGEFGREPSGYQDIVGTCATAADIGQALSRINSFYQSLGFITTRAYVPEQDIADGSLSIIVIPGRLEGYVYSSGAPADARISLAFPEQRGDLLNLRGLEQGLENINGPRSVSGDFQLVPGEDPGGSFVQIQLEESRPWHLSIDLDNSGFENTGVLRANASFTIDNTFSLNDQLRLNISSTPFDARGKKYADNLIAGWSLSVKNWLLGLDAGYSQYYYLQQGINQSFPVSGNTWFATAFAERLLWRDQKSKVYAFGDLKRTRTRTFIDGFEIRTQRRDLTIGSLGLRGDHSFETGQVNWNLSTRFGLDALGSRVLRQSIVDSDFKLLKARVNVIRRLSASGITFRGSLAGQITDNILPSTEQFSIGSWATVRGFHDDSTYGDSGFYVRNTFEWQAYRDDDLTIGVNLGFDYGYVKPSALRRWSRRDIAGVSFGTDVTFKNRATLRVQVARALMRPDRNPPNAQPAFEADRTVGFISLTTVF